MTKLFEMRTVQSSAVRLLFEVLKDILNDCNLQIDSMGVRCLAMDNSNTSLVHLRLDAAQFEVFNLGCERLDIGINCMQMFRILKIAGSNDTIEISMDASSTDEISMVIDNSDKKTTTYFKLKLLDLNESTLSIPAVEMDAVFTMNSQEFQRLIRDMQNLGQIVKIRVHGDELSLSCEGDYAEQESILKETINGLTFLKKTAVPICNEYSLKFMSLFVKASNLSGTIELFMKNDYPIIMRYQVASLGQLRFVLAPRATD